MFSQGCAPLKRSVHISLTVTSNLHLARYVGASSEDVDGIPLSSREQMAAKEKRRKRKKKKERERERTRAGFNRAVRSVS